MMYAADIFEKINDLKVTLQGKRLLAHKMWNHVKSFRANLDLFARQAVNANFCHFPYWANRKYP